MAKGYKTGGRQKGTPHKGTQALLQQRAAIWAYIEAEAAREAMAHPVKLLVSIMTSETSGTSERIHAATVLLDRLLPKLKSVEVTGELDCTTWTPEQRQARITALLAKRRNAHAAHP